jgi:hypothetical protein
MLRKISFLSLGSMAMVFCFLLSINVMAADKSTKHKIKSSSTFGSIDQISMIAELYVNFAYTYFPITNSNSLQAIQQTQKHPELLEKKDANKIMVTKDDYHYYFKKDKELFSFIYAVKDNNIPLYDGFEYESETKILVGQQIFSFNMLNGRPVGLLHQTNTLSQN